MPEDRPAPDRGPVILHRSSHTISRKLIDEDALKVLYRLHRSGYTAYLVGGGVRDLLLGKVPKDFDVATSAHPHQVKELFRNSRIIGRRFRLVHVFFRGGKIVEVSTFRSHSEFEEAEAEDGTLVYTESFGTPEEDALRRDITINGLFYSVADFSIIDHVGGLEDLDRGVIRTIGDPDERFRQDPVRMIRVLRHAARTGFTIDRHTYEAVVRHRDEIRLCSSSRVRDEFLRDLREGCAGRTLELLIDTGLLFSFFPDLARAYGDRNPRRKTACAVLLESFGLVDGLIRSGRPVSDPVILALFLGPYIQAVSPEHPFLGEKERHHYEIEAIRTGLHQVFGPFSFPKGPREMAALILTAQPILHQAALKGAVPKRLSTKRYFPEALLYLGIEAKARGGEVPRPLRQAAPASFLPWWPAEAEKQEDPRKRRSRRRRRRPSLHEPRGEKDRNPGE
jgi:poly(A) polymerase